METGGWRLGRVRVEKMGERGNGGEGVNGSSSWCYSVKNGEVNPETELEDLADHWRGWLESVCKCSEMVEGLDPRCLRG
jgi:hypothetical protein